MLSGKKVKILIVDDEKDMCNIISTILKEEGYLVDIARSGESALGKLKKRKYEFMILDYKLPGISGLTLLEEINHIRTRVKTIMISAFGNENVKAKAKELGVVHFLDKPFNVTILVPIKIGRAHV